jgi:DNA-binding NarL/FixJ family response regulator
MPECTENAIEENYCALALSILTKRKPEQSLDYIHHGKRRGVKYASRSDVELDIGEMVEMWQAGMFYRQIGEVFGLSESTVNNRIRRYRLNMQAEGVIPSDRK